MQYQIPQFLEVEDKLFGSFTFKQFLYAAGAAGMGYVAYSFLPRFLGVPVVMVAVTLGVCFAFFRPNNKPFSFFLAAVFTFATSSRLYIWRKVPKKITPKKEEGRGDVARTLSVPHLSQNKLKELAWSLDIHEKVSPAERPLGEMGELELRR